MQLINKLDGITKTKGWSNHPALKMWVGYTNALKLYCNTMIDEWILRGYKNTMKKYDLEKEGIVYPPWFGNENFHLCHRARLMQKDTEFYSKYNWFKDKSWENMEYFWPI